MSCFLIFSSIAFLCLLCVGFLAILVTEHLGNFMVVCVSCPGLSSSVQGCFVSMLWFHGSSAVSED